MNIPKIENSDDDPPLYTVLEIVYKIRPVASLIKLSPSMTVLNLIIKKCRQKIEEKFGKIFYFFGAPSSFNNATTAIGSVQDTIDPNMKALSQV
jgi:hypothetical protein